MDTKYHEQYIRFGLKVQYYRKLSGMTQEAFADEIGKSWSFVAKIESPSSSLPRKVRRERLRLTSMFED